MASFQTYPPVINAVTLLINSKLWGFVTPASVDTALIREAVAKIQPHYAVPAHYMALEEFPTTRNGKVDKRALSALAEGGMTTSMSVSLQAPPPNRHRSHLHLSSNRRREAGALTCCSPPRCLWSFQACSPSWSSRNCARTGCTHDIGFGFLLFSLDYGLVRTW